MAFCHRLALGSLLSKPRACEHNFPFGVAVCSSTRNSGCTVTCSFLTHHCIQAGDTVHRHWLDKSRTFWTLLDLNLSLLPRCLQTRMLIDLSICTDDDCEDKSLTKSVRTTDCLKAGVSMSGRLSRHGPLHKAMSPSLMCLPVSDKGAPSGKADGGGFRQDKGTCRSYTEELIYFGAYGWRR
jgi:hypothetical protein